MRHVVRRVMAIVVSVVALLILAAVGLLPAQPVHAAALALTVNLTTDTVPGTGQQTGPTSGDLRWGIAQADANPGSTITFNPTVFATPQTITLQQGTLTLSANMTLTGPGASMLAVDGNNTVTVFQVNSGVTATLTALTIQHGSAAGNSGGIVNNGGTVTVTTSIFTNNLSGIANNGGTVTVTDSTFTDNIHGIDILSGTMTVMTSTFSGNTTGAGGSGIQNNGGILAVTNSTFSRNTTGAGGSGIQNNGGTVAVTNSTFSGNLAVAGGGIRNNSGTVAVTDSTFAGNTANVGGGIANSGTMTVTNSTVSGNSATSGGGGGIVNDGTLSVTNSTVSGNTTGSGGGGGGITNSTGPATVTNTILAGNVATSGLTTARDASGIFTSDGGNLVGVSGAGSGNTGFTAPTDQTGTVATPLDPHLGTLGSNGGPTQTLPLLAGSPAIGHGDATVCANTGGAAPVAGRDQRGLPRPTAACAIGAYEPQPFTITTTGGTPQQALVGTAFVTNLAATVMDNQTNPLPGWSVTFTPPPTGPSGAFASSAVVTTTASGVATAPTFTANTHAGTYSVSANLSTTPLASPASFILTNLPGPATTLTVTGYPLSVVSGTSHPFILTAFDQFGNTATGYTGTVHFTSTDTLATLPADHTFLATDAGVQTFSATFGAPGTWSLTASDTTTTSITGTQSGIMVTAAPLVSIAVTPASMTVKVGETLRYTATGTYADNSTADVTSTVTWSSDVTTVASVDTSGKVLGLSPGSAHVTATQGSMSGQTSVTVSAGTPVGIAPAPVPVSRSGSAGTTPPVGSPLPGPNPIPAGR